MKLHDLSLCLHLWWENKVFFIQVLFVAFYFLSYTLWPVCDLRGASHIYVALVQAHLNCGKLPHSFKSQQLPRANCFIKHVNSVYKEWSWVTHWCQVLGASESGVTFRIPWRGHLTNFTVQMNWQACSLCLASVLILVYNEKEEWGNQLRSNCLSYPLINVCFSDDRIIMGHNEPRCWLSAFFIMFVITLKHMALTSIAKLSQLFFYHGGDFSLTLLFFYFHINVQYLACLLSCFHCRDHWRALTM